MARNPRSAPVRFWVESVFATAGAVAAVLTVAWRDWLEVLLHVDPDHHGGAVEWLVAGGFALVGLVAGCGARRHRRPRAARTVPDGVLP